MSNGKGESKICAWFDLVCPNLIISNRGHLDFMIDIMVHYSMLYYTIDIYIVDNRLEMYIKICTLSFIIKVVVA